ncbi:MAG: ferrochelatase [Pseudomonadales bacterium]|nr:ferrochelatase [Pseudomonadales bacterium]
MNLGTPEQPTASSIRTYLKEFLWDKRVVELPRPLWWLILNFIILPLRPRQIAHAYQAVWQKNGSPLRVISVEQAKKLQAHLDQQTGESRCQVELAMTYGQPNFGTAWQNLKTQGVENVFVLPLYPQYSATTTGAVFDQLSQTFQNERNVPELRLCKDYHQHATYIDALAKSVRSHREKREENQEQIEQDFLLFSFHGIPKACIDKGDPYYEQCKLTAEKVAKHLGLKPEQWQVSFQSRVGKAEWLQPYTDETVRQLGEKGLQRLDVICPGFSADCLETLEEINMQNRELYEKSGGLGFHYIPALNSSKEHIQLFSALYKEKCHDWI